MAYTAEENKERQEALYRFLLSRGDHWTPSEMATSFVTQYPAFFEGYYHNSNAVSGNKGIKLATEEEFSRFLNSDLNKEDG